MVYYVNFRMRQTKVGRPVNFPLLLLLQLHRLGYPMSTTGERRKRLLSTVLFGRIRSIYASQVPECKIWPLFEWKGFVEVNSTGQECRSGAVLMLLPVCGVRSDPWHCSPHPCPNRAVHAPQKGEVRQQLLSPVLPLGWEWYLITSNMQTSSQN